MPSIAIAKAVPEKSNSCVQIPFHWHIGIWFFFSIKKRVSRRTTVMWKWESKQESPHQLMREKIRSQMYHTGTLPSEHKSIVAAFSAQFERGEPDDTLTGPHPSCREEPGHTHFSPTHRWLTAWDDVLPIPWNTINAPPPIHWLGAHMLTFFPWQLMEVRA